MSKFPLNDPERGRTFMELRFNHLRELYNDELPPLYYVFRLRGRTLEAGFKRYPLLRLFLLGSTKGGKQAWGKARPILSKAWSSGQSERSFCPVVGRSYNMLVFKLDPVLPILRRWWTSKGFPTAQQFGPSR